MANVPAYIPHQPKSPFLVRNRTKLGRIAFIPVVPVILFVQHSWPEATYIDFTLDSLGYGLLIAGVLVRLWSTLYIGGKKDSVLQRTGPYSLVRHPLYLGSLLIGVGFASLTENPIVLAIILSYFCGQYRTTILHEETVLARLFPIDYPQYRHTTPCFLPKLSSFDSTAPESISPGYLRREIIHCSIALMIVPLMELIALLHETGVLPYLAFP